MRGNASNVKTDMNNALEGLQERHKHALLFSQVDLCKDNSIPSSFARGTWTIIGLWAVSTVVTK
jgi:hypothetical protein